MPFRQHSPIVPLGQRKALAVRARASVTAVAKYMLLDSFLVFLC